MAHASGARVSQISGILSQNSTATLATADQSLAGVELQAGIQKSPLTDSRTGVKD